MKKLAAPFLGLFLCFTVYGQVPQAYYATASGKSGDTLRSALRDIITNGHVKLPYTSTSFDVWDAYAITDVRPSPDTTIIWDMYSDIPNGSNYTFTIYTDQCGTAGTEGACYAREHLTPNSWWGGFDNLANPQYTDLHHLFPADQYVNNKKSAHPLGEITSPTWTSTNGSKVGPCSWSGGYSGTAFEPINEYKGDFARATLYVATRYMNELSSWLVNFPSTEAQHVIDTSTDNFKQWYIDMLIAWHNNDPVSQKEIGRNDAVYYNTPQHNRNPFVDHPEYVCEIWTSVSCTDAPSITSIVNSPVYPNSSDTMSVTANVTDNDTVISVTLQWCTDGTSFGDTIMMSANTVPNYIITTSIPPQTGGTTVYYTIKATDNDSNSTTSPVQSYTVLKDEPASHVTAFTCDTTTTASISISWTDPTGGNAPDGYLIKISSVSYNAISDPTDGIAEPNSTFVHNVGSGIQTDTFNGLSQSMTYYFKIFPYTNPSSVINYKTTGIVPSTSCATAEKIGCADGLIISEYIEGSGSNKYIELYNNTGAPVDLSGYRLQLFINGNVAPTNNILLSGVLNNQTTIVYKNSSALIYSGAAISNPSVNFNGNDAVVLFRISDSSFVDIVGRIGEDPVTAWTNGSHTTVDKTLVRNSDVTKGITTNPSSGFPTLATEWTVYNEDDVSHLGTHTMDCASCASPTVASSSFSFSSATETTATINWTNGNGSKRIVLAKQGSAVSSSPIDGVTYISDTAFGSGATIGSNEYVVYNGSDSSVSITNLESGQTYYFTVFEYDCEPGSEIYLTPGSGAILTTYSLLTGSTNDNTICVTPDTGYATDILFISTGGFNSNTYTAQLSDSLGSFANAVTIGTLVSNSNNGTVNCLIPANTASGNGYKIRVLSSGPSLIGSESDPFKIVLNPPCIAPDSATSNRNSFCVNDSSTINLSIAGGSGTTLAWYTSACGDSLIGTGNPLTIPSPDSSTTYYARWENYCEVSACAALTITVVPNVLSSISIAADQGPGVCAGKNITFTATPANGGTPAYQWKNNGINIPGATDSTYSSASLNNSDTITCQMISTVACQVGSPAISNALAFTVDTTAAPSGDSIQTFCNAATVADLTATGTGIKWYTTDSAGTALDTTTTLINNMLYFASQTINNCESINRFEARAIINTPSAPTGDSIQTFCNAATVADLAASGTGIKWYTTDSAGTALDTTTVLINNTHYFASQTINDCESINRFEVTAIINTPAAPTGDSIQTFCNAATVADLAASGTGIKWYTTDSAGTALDTTAVLINNTHYFASQTINNCESINRLEVTAIINTPAAPTGDSIQTFCNAATVADLTGTGTAIKWYATDSADTALDTTTTLINNTHYFASQTINNCESINRLEVTAIINTPAAPTGDSIQTFCNAAIVADLTATGTGIKWYASDSAETALDTTTTLINSTYYFASQTINNCESINRFEVTTTINTPTAPTGDSIQTFCNTATVADLTAIGTGIKWYTADSADTALDTTTTLINSTYYFASQTINNCESINRLEVTAIINTPAAPTGDSIQTFCNAATVADLAATGMDIKWYATDSSQTALNTTTALINSTHYFASQTINNCESINRFEVTTTINTPTAPTGDSAQAFCNAATVADLTATGTGIKWYISDTTSIALDTVAALTNGAHYFATQSTNNCESPTRLELAVAINPVPSFTSTLQPDAICSNTVFNYNPTSTTAGALFTWIRNNISGVSNPANSGNDSFSETLINTTTNPIAVTYTYTVMAEGCINDTAYDVIVWVNPIPAASLLPFPTICSQTTGFTLTGGMPAGGAYSGTGVASGIFYPANAGSQEEIIYTVTDTNSCTNSATEIIVVGNCTYIETATTSQKITLYPNPSQGFVNIEAKDMSSQGLSMSIRDVQGRVLLEISDTINSKDYHKQINLESLSKGIYYLHLKTDTGSKTVTLILQ